MFVREIKVLVDKFFKDERDVNKERLVKRISLVYCFKLILDSDSVLRVGGWFF